MIGDYCESIDEPPVRDLPLRLEVGQRLIIPPAAPRESSSISPSAGYHLSLVANVNVRSKFYEN